MLTLLELFFWYCEHSSHKGGFWTPFPGLTGFFEKWTFINVQNPFGDIKFDIDFGSLFALGLLWCDDI